MNIRLVDEHRRGAAAACAGIAAWDRRMRLGWAWWGGQSGSASVPMGGWVGGGVGGEAVRVTRDEMTHSSSRDVCSEYSDGTRV